MLNKLMALSTNLLNIVSWDEAPKATVGETALYAILGYLVVFIGIAFLIFVVWGIGKILSKINGESHSVEKNKKEEKKPVQTQAPQTTEDELNDETVAVIMAALMAYYQQTNAKCDFIVKRIKRI